MRNCIALGCNQLIEDTEKHCEEHRESLSEKRSALVREEGNALKECAPYQKLRRMLRITDANCFKCKGTADVIHLINSYDVNKYDFKQYILLCHKCHALSH